ncbi:MAG: CoA transferase, partial [Dehalococcoidia bacterium]|nr:CoA transferase [Dehalococcoidia bacterium]
MTEQALSDMKVIDLTQYIAGPACTKLLADFGADVIKIERPGTGDGARTMGPFYHDEPDLDKSGLFLYLNTNKRGVTLNLKSVLGKEMLMAMVKRADVVVENFKPGVMDRLGLSY